jgi:hypothetical protein
LCAEAALAELGIRSTQVVRCRDGAPVWPAGSCGSITHSQDLAAAVVGRSRHWSALGLDSEALLTPAQAADVAQMCCDPAERHAVVPPGHGPCGLRCTVLFCAKEAWFKAVAGRLPRRLGFDEVRVTGLEDLPRLPSGDRLGGRHNDFQCGLSGRCHVAATAPDLAAFHDPLPAAWHIEQGALHLLLAMPAEAS